MFKMNAYDLENAYYLAGELTMLGLKVIEIKEVSYGYIVIYDNEDLLKMYNNMEG